MLLLLRRRLCSTPLTSNACTSAGRYLDTQNMLATHLTSSLQSPLYTHSPSSTLTPSGPWRRLLLNLHNRKPAGRHSLDKKHHTCKRDAGKCSDTNVSVSKLQSAPVGACVICALPASALAGVARVARAPAGVAVCGLLGGWVMQDQLPLCPLSCLVGASEEAQPICKRPLALTCVFLATRVCLSTGQNG